MFFFRSFQLEEHYEKQNEVLTSLKPAYELYKRDVDRTVTWLGNLKVRLQHSNNDPAVFQVRVKRRD